MISSLAQASSVSDIMATGLAVNEVSGPTEVLLTGKLMRKKVDWDTKLQTTYLRSPARVRFEVADNQARTASLNNKEKALDRLSMLDGGWRGGLSLPPTAVQETPEAWWMQQDDPTDILWQVALGQVENVVRARESASLPDDKLPPPYGAGYVLNTQAHPLEES